MVNITKNFKHYSIDFGDYNPDHQSTGPEKSVPIPKNPDHVEPQGDQDDVHAQENLDVVKPHKLKAQLNLILLW